jgi:hypothetical protein
MTEQPKEYIITTDMLIQWRSGCCRMMRTYNGDGDICYGCPFDNKKRGCDFDDDAMQKIFQSRPVSTPPVGVAPDYEHCGNMSSDGEHDCNYRGGHCNFAHTRHCKDFIPCTCEYCDGTVHDAAIRQEAITEHDWLLRQNRDNILCFYENPEELKKFKDEIRQAAREEVLDKIKASVEVEVSGLKKSDSMLVEHLNLGELHMAGVVLTSTESLRHPTQKKEVP